MFAWVYSLFSNGKTHEQHVAAKAQFKAPQSKVFEIDHHQAQTMIVTKPRNTLFHVKVIKRTDGCVREMLCVQNEISSKYEDSLSYVPAEKDLVCIYDCFLGEPRMINLRSILELRMHDNIYCVK